jgi:hypothetical protein
MEVYILDSLLRRDTVVDVFDSLIWTERYKDVGDFKLVLASTPANKRRFTTGVRLAQNESYRVMTVETVEDSTDDDGRATITITGRSLESVLEDRVAKKTMSNLTTEAKWVLTGTPLQVMTTMFDGVCRTGTLNLGDKIPFLQPGTIFPAGTIPFPQEPITWEQTPASLYDAEKALADAYDLGFRLVRNFDTSQLYFDIYTGSDRTTAQTVLPPVVFAPGLDNLKNTTQLNTIDQAKNVAYVFSEQGYEVVYPIDVDPSVEGFDRRVMMVQADNLEGSPSAAVVSAYLIQKGREELAQHRSIFAFDGEIDQNSQYKYNVHYNLGDIVEVRDDTGAANNMRVTEQIFVSDKEGDRSYPTLTVNMTINPGAWLAWDFNQVWQDLGTETWAEQV